MMMRVVNVCGLVACVSADAGPTVQAMDGGVDSVQLDGHFQKVKEEMHEMHEGEDGFDGAELEHGDYDADRETHLKEQFKSIDTNQDGSVTREEAIAMITATDEHTRAEETASIDQFLEQADGNNDGYVTEEEYITFANKVDEEHYEQNYQKIQSEFQEADADGDGQVTEEEVRKLVGAEVPEDDIKAFMHDADENADGFIDATEYHLYAQSQEDMYGENYHDEVDEWTHDHHDDEHAEHGDVDHEAEDDSEMPPEL